MRRQEEEQRQQREEEEAARKEAELAAAAAAAAMAKIEAAPGPGDGVTKKAKKKDSFADSLLADLVSLKLRDDQKEVEDFVGLDADGRAPEPSRTRRPHRRDRYRAQAR